MSFPDIPEDLFNDFDWSEFDQQVVEQQIEFVNNFDDERLDTLGRLVDGYEADAERSRRVLQVVNRILSLGMRVV